MKRLIFIISTFVAIALIIFACNDKSKEPGATTLSKDDSLKQQLERGKYLANSVVNCADCHSKLDTSKFSAPVVPGTEGGGGLALHEILPADIPGKMWVPNITPYALKDWTDDEIARAITAGVNKKGDTLFPLMPYHGLSRMAKEDVEAVVAYLRSLKPIVASFPARELFIPAAAFGPLPDVDYKKNTRPDTADKVMYGEYLVTIGHCTDCHTPVTKEKMPMMDKFLSGGQHFKLPTFEVTVSNITPDSVTGLGTWTEAMFLAKFRTNSTPEMLASKPGKANTLMPWSFYGTMSDSDLKAIYAYLRTVPPIKNKVEKWPTAAVASR
ncbi:MAG TPA: c-type cytochrome [Chitinophagaceae bacterium]|nr:c-type cytochrome [Chitinophagaceae bacterium]